jgi:hypothetical protein
MNTLGCGFMNTLGCGFMTLPEDNPKRKSKNQGTN